MATGKKEETMDGWIISQTRPGYREKTIQSGAATLVIFRPILDPEELTRKENQTRTALAGVMRDYVQRRQTQ